MRLGRYSETKAWGLYRGRTRNESWRSQPGGGCETITRRSRVFRPKAGCIATAMALHLFMPPLVGAEGARIPVPNQRLSATAREPEGSLQLEFPSSVAVDRKGRVFIVASQQHQVFQLDSSGHLALVAGTGTADGSGDDGPATRASLHYPSTITFDSEENLLIAEPLDHRIRRVSRSTGIITSIAEAGKVRKPDGEGAASDRILGSPTGMSVDRNGSLIIVDRATFRVQRMDRSGAQTILAGNGTRGFAGDGGRATDASLDPMAVVIEKSGDILIADSGNHRIRRVVAANGMIMTVAGTGTPGFDGDGGPAQDAKLGNPVAIALGPTGDLFIADSTNHRIRRVDLSSGIIVTVAGTGSPGFAGDGGAATQAQLDAPTGVAVDLAGNVYIADLSNQRVRRVDAKTGHITSVAGKGISATVSPKAPSPIKSPPAGQVEGKGRS